jgi:uncharacterized protein (DUF1330 family)
MSYYFLANIDIQDQQEYQKYLDEADRIFKKFKGKYLAVDNSPVILEGKWNYTRAVLIEFETKEDFSAWYYSEDYQRILKFRLIGANCDSLLLKGK